jgi:hypothetical protein
MRIEIIKLSTLVCNMILFATHTIAYCEDPSPSRDDCSTEVEKLGDRDATVCASYVVNAPRPSVNNSAPSAVLIVI